MKQKYFWLKLIGVVLLLHALLIVLSIIEVAIYSYIINPGHTKEFYSQHANESGPWISTLFGPLLIFLVVKRFIRRFSYQHLTYAIAVPVIYTLTDYLIFAASGAGADVFSLPIILSHALKIVAGLAAWFLFSKSKSK